MIAKAVTLVAIVVLVLGSDALSAYAQRPEAPYGYAVYYRRSDGEPFPNGELERLKGVTRRYDEARSWIDAINTVHAWKAFGRDLSQQQYNDQADANRRKYARTKVERSEVIGTWKNIDPESLGPTEFVFMSDDTYILPIPGRRGAAGRWYIDGIQVVLKRGDDVVGQFAYAGDTLVFSTQKKGGKYYSYVKAQ